MCQYLPGSADSVWQSSLSSLSSASWMPSGVMYTEKQSQLFALNMPICSCSSPARVFSASLRCIFVGGSAGGSGPDEGLDLEARVWITGAIGELLSGMAVQAWLCLARPTVRARCSQNKRKGSTPSLEAENGCRASSAEREGGWVGGAEREWAQAKHDDLKPDGLWPTCSPQHRSFQVKTREAYNRMKRSMGRWMTYDRMIMHPPTSQMIRLASIPP